MDARLQSDLTRLVKPSPGKAALPDATPLAAKQTGVGLARAAGNDGTGIASPLTETDYTAREYHATEGELQTTDGFFVIKYQYIKSVSMTDAQDQPVKLEFDAP
jgi:hypothetical protein